MAFVSAQSTDSQGQILGNADTANDQGTSPEQAAEGDNVDDGGQEVDANDQNLSDSQDQGPYDSSSYGDFLDRRSFVPFDVLDGHHDDYYGLTKREPILIERRSFGGGFHHGCPHKFGKAGGFGRFGGVAKVGGVFRFPTIFANQNRFNLRKKKLQKFRFKNRKNKRVKAAHGTKFFS
ncbi:hypothetical protein H4R35_002869 [Dimargaris xerosporica]|nr:hypothetical protein H4R35_002869 [Dimargaris xerosporica]